jgi:hypothetical protein
MIRLSIAATVFVSLAGCGSGTKAGNNTAAADAGNQNVAAPAAAAPAANAAAPAPQNAQAAAGPAVPASYDWVLDVHGGSAQIIFGDGDIAEGESLLSFSCLPGSNETEANWIEERPATLRSGAASADLQPDSTMKLDHPVLQALRSSGEIRLVRNGQEQRLAAKKVGKDALADFFEYCGKPGTGQR